MKLLLISVQDATARGGIAVWTEHFLSGCQLHNLECALVNTKMIGKRGEQGTAGRNFWDEVRRTYGIFRELNRKLKENTFRVAHLNTSCGKYGLFRDYLIAHKICRKGIPVVTHYHCDIPDCISSAFGKKCLEKLAKCSHRNLVLCENSRKYLLAHFGVDAVKIPNFVDGRLIVEGPKTINPKLQNVFFAGRVSVAKGAEEIYTLARKFPEITFSLAGDVSDAVEAWEKPDNLLLLGGMSHEEVIKEMDEADVFLLPSHSEGFSVALLESMARGVPAIATDVGAARDMLADGCGIVVEKGNVDAMKKALQQLMSPEERGKMSAFAVEKTKTHYNTEAVMEMIIRQYP